jgi:site-specific recombinase XerD
MKLSKDQEKTIEVDEHHKKVNGKNGVYLVKKVKSDLDKRLTAAEEQLLLTSFTYENHKSNAERNRSIIMLFLNTGLRVGEMAQLKLYDVFEMQGELKDVLVVRPEIAKRNKSRQIPLNGSAKESLRTLIGNNPKDLTSSILKKNNGDPLTRRSIQDIVKNACLRAGIDRLIGPHVLRHTFLSKVYANTKNVKITQQLAGHTDPKLTMQMYTHTTIDEMTDAVEGLNG